MFWIHAPGDRQNALPSLSMLDVFTICCTTDTVNWLLMTTRKCTELMCL